MDKSDERLYFLAIIPPEPIFSEILTMKRYFSDRYNSKAGLRSPPHITLHMPFKWNTKNEKRLISTMEELSPNHFKISLDGFGAFVPRVIFINVTENDTLYELHKRIAQNLRQKCNVFNADYKGRGYTPHITLAFRDLKKTEFLTAWKEFETKTFQASFEVSAFTLLRHTSKIWEPIRDF